MKTSMDSNKFYRAAVISVCVGYALDFAMHWFDLSEIVYTLLLLIIFGLLGFAYKTILIRKGLPSFFVVFGGFAVVLFWGGMLAQLFSLITYLLELTFL